MPSGVVSLPFSLITLGISIQAFARFQVSSSRTSSLVYLFEIASSAKLFYACLLFNVVHSISGVCTATDNEHLRKVNRSKFPVEIKQKCFRNNMNMCKWRS